MRWSHVRLEAIAYELPEERVTTAELESRLAPLYQTLRIGGGQVQALTGIRERRFWPRGPVMSECAAKAGKKALAMAGLSGSELGAVIYAGVCRDNLEPATACAVAHSLGAPPDALVFDLANACLGVLNGMVEIANKIELGQIKAGIIVSAESSREIVETTIARMLKDPTLERFRLCLATMTGGSGAVAVVLTSDEISRTQRKLVGGAALAASEHHKICRWGPESGLLGETPNLMETDASQVMVHGINLGKRTWARFLESTGWQRQEVDKVICHQVGSGHRRNVLETIGVDLAKDFSTFELLANIGTVSVPLTAARANEDGFLLAGDKVGLLGIGSGLNCLMLGVQW